MSIRALALLAILAGGISGPALAGGGDDHTHGDEPTAVARVSAPRIAAASETLELVGVLDPAGLTIYLDRPGTNEPVFGANIAVDVDGESREATVTEDGNYRLDGAWAGRAGNHDFVFTVVLEDGADLISGTLVVPEGIAPAHDDHYLAWAAGAAGVIALAFAAAWLLRRRRFAVAAAALLLATLAMPRAEAGGGDDHTHGEEEVESTGFVLGMPDSPYRLPNGSLFVPKATQRLIGLRTEIATTATESRSKRLLGRLVPDPARAGLVQSVAGGRIVIPEAGLPSLGANVARGQVLAYVEPALSGGDLSALSAERTAVATELAVAEQRLARLERLGGTVAGREIDEARLQAEGLRRRSAELKGAAARREVLRAPVAGQLARMNVVAGQVVTPDLVLFEIAAPGALAVEASSYAPEQFGERASARLPDGRVLQLTLVGQGTAFDGQALLLRYRVDEAPAGLPLYTPVTVLPRLAETREGIPVPAAAIVQSTAGTPLVWVKVAPETFAPRDVVFEDLDGGRVLVVAGLKSPARVVVKAAGLVNQIR